MKEKRKKISILGCGWLGLPLAEQLIQQGFFIKGSTTTKEKEAVLLQNKIQPFIVSLSEKKIVGNIEDFLQNSEILIINIPPKLRKENAENFVQKIENLIPFIEQSTIKKVLFVSSISVYADEFPIVEINENSIPNPTTESGKQLLETEKLLLSNPNFQTTIIRLGGLIGKNRHPVYYLAGKTNLPNPEAPINFISQENAISLLVKLIKTSKEIKIVNGVDQNHRTRQEFYTSEAKRLNLIVPQFNKNTISKGKKVR
ncbi:SDR family NAD(P)-dependent oxidoreductase [Flavobacterium sp.]|uniref:SDR family NAD(P)-dependent oxidoreductase n=1 Tax=Flavobacterium sp. TaxID=239 RepID=UPI003528CAB0